MTMNMNMNNYEYECCCCLKMLTHLFKYLFMRAVICVCMSVFRLLTVSVYECSYGLCICLKFVRVCVYVYFLNICAYRHTYIRTYRHADIHTYIYTCIYIYIHIQRYRSAAICRLNMAFSFRACREDAISWYTHIT